MSALIADTLLILGTAAITLSIGGIIYLPDPYVKIHSASKALTLGVFLILLTSWVISEADVIGRAMLVGLFLLLTAPVGAHALARLEAQLREDERAQRHLSAKKPSAEMAPKEFEEEDNPHAK